MKRNKRYRKDESSFKEKLEREGEHNPKRCEPKHLGSPMKSPRKEASLLASYSATLLLDLNINEKSNNHFFWKIQIDHLHAPLSQEQPT